MKLLQSLLISLLLITISSCNGESEEKEKETLSPKTSDSNITYENAITEAPENPNATSFKVEGNLSDGTDQKIYLYQFKNQKPSPIDSTIIDAEGNYSLKGKGEGYQFYALGSSPKKFRVLLLNSTESVSVDGDYNLIQETEIEGSTDSKILDTYSKKQKEFYMKMQELQNNLKTLPQNSTDRTVLIQQSEKLTKEHTKYAENFIDQNLNSPAVLSASNDLFDPKTQLAYLKKIENTLSKTMKNSIFHTSLKGNIAKIKQQQTQQPKQNGVVQIGQQAPELNFTSPSGKSIALSSLKGKVVLIDFWASWCKPCRMENPNVVRLYNEYKDKGFTIYSVSLDKDKARWESAIQQDGLIWPNHVSDLKGWQSAASARYGVNGIPYTVLLDKDGKVIATSLRGIQLEQKLKEILG
jgi:thiol-disulfide isomerase/thioredoxin